MKPYRLLKDPLFIGATVLYAINRWVIGPRVESRFLEYYFNDILLIPCAIPVLIVLQQILGLRREEGPPRWTEVLLYLGVWSVLFEVVGPHLMSRSTGDPYDVLAYSAGALVAGLWWSYMRRKGPAIDAHLTPPSL